MTWVTKSTAGNPIVESRRTGGWFHTEPVAQPAREEILCFSPILNRPSLTAMADASRRTFLVAAGAGAAAVGIAAVSPTAAAAATDKDTAKPAELPSGEALVAYVSNAKTGELTLMVGEREVIVHDSALVARLVRAAH